MASPIGIGDIIALGGLALRTWEAFQRAGENYSHLTHLCKSIHLATKDTRRHVTDEESTMTLDLIVSGLCRSLEMADMILNSYEGMAGRNWRSTFKRLTFSLATTSEQKAIEERLSIQLQTLTLFLSGQTLEQGALVGKLVRMMIEEKQTAAGEKVDVQKILNDQDAFNDVLDQLDVKDESTKEKMEGRKEGIKKEINKEIAQELAGAGGITTAARIQLQMPSGPAPTKFETFWPLSMPWFSELQTHSHNAFHMVGLTAAHQNFPHLSELTIRYSEQDEFLCSLQEGWTLNRTYVMRFNQPEMAYYFSYNGLSCNPMRPIKSTRLYFRNGGLITDEPSNPPVPSPWPQPSAQGCCGSTAAVLQQVGQSPPMLQPATFICS